MICRLNKYIEMANLEEQLSTLASDLRATLPQALSPPQQFNAEELQAVITAKLITPLQTQLKGLESSIQQTTNGLQVSLQNKAGELRSAQTEFQKSMDEKLTSLQNEQAKQISNLSSLKSVLDAKSSSAGLLDQGLPSRVEKLEADIQVYAGQLRELEETLKKPKVKLMNVYSTGGIAKVALTIRNEKYYRMERLQVAFKTEGAQTLYAEIDGVLDGSQQRDIEVQLPRLQPGKPYEIQISLNGAQVSNSESFRV